MISAAAERNKGPILDVIKEVLASRQRVLEIGSGTGQHAVHFAAAMPWLTWQATDRRDYLAMLAACIESAALDNCLPPVELDVKQRPWSIQAVDAVFSANTLHIMSWREVREFFSGTGEVLEAGGCLCVYGPFRYGGEFTTPSNAAFNRSLQLQDPESGIRDFEAVNELAGLQGLSILADHPMPANNQLLVWVRE
ncbi:MAG: DUF938 domain-containing protein [Gammaproteobacteria bacterium]|nr:DUF938 domain-containing protein [Gammaproteobacteria bacterium]